MKFLPNSRVLNMTLFHQRLFYQDSMEMIGAYDPKIRFDFPMKMPLLTKSLRGQVKLIIFGGGKK